MALATPNMEHSLEGRAVPATKTTDHDLNRALQMAAWLLLAITSLMVGFRLLTRFFLRSNKVVSFEEGLAFFAYVRVV